MSGCCITRLRLHHFRNYAEETVHLGAGLNVIAGSNAQGKTNLLEAVATLALTRSPRAAASSDLLQWGSDRCQVEATVQRGSITADVAVRFERSDGLERLSRRTMIDAKPREARALLGMCPVVLFWPEDLQLVKAGPDNRRRLLDTLLTQLDPRATAHLLRFRRVLEQRNALLHRIRQEGRSRAELAGFTQELAHHGARIIVARMRLVDALSPRARTALHDLSGGRERLELRYVSTVSAVTDDDDAAELAMLDRLRQRADDEAARGMTLVGPHRDDVDIELDGRPARHAASQGQQRSIVLACKLAEMRHVADVIGHAPVVLLDDVLSELDRQRRADLLAALAGGVQQVLVTTTEPMPDVTLFSGVRHFAVHSGVVRESAG